MRLTKKLVVLIVLLQIAFSCTEEDKFTNYSVYIKNESGVDVSITSYLNNLQVEQIVINNNTRAFNCNYENSSFVGYGICNIDSLKISFSNNKGFLYSFRDNTDYNFGDDYSIFTGSRKFVNMGNNIFEYTINSEDFDSAFDLP